MRSIRPKQLARTSLLALAMLVAAAALAGSAQAQAKDRNHDGISDRWEKKHHLSLRVSQARRDQDHDGVNNLCENAASLNPRAKDSDHDGVKDGSEDTDGDGLSNRSESRDHTDCDQDEAGDNAGTVVSFDAGTLVIKTGTDANGADVTVSGTVDANTEFECFVAGHDGCEHAPPATATAQTSRDGSEGDSHEGEAEQEGDDDAPAAGCSSADLVPGAVIHEAELVDGVFTKIEIVK